MARLFADETLRGSCREVASRKWHRLPARDPRPRHGRQPKPPPGAPTRARES